MSVGVDIGRVGDVVAGSLQPSDEVDLPVQEASVASVGVRSIEGHPHCARRPRERVRTGAVVVVEALPRRAIIRVVVVGLVRRHALLIEQVGGPRIVADHEVDVVLIGLRIREQDQVDSVGPRRRHGEGVTRRPSTLHQTGAGVDWTGRLRTSGERPDPLHEPGALPLIPADSIDVHGEQLGGIHGDIKRDRFTFVHAGRRSVSLDLFVDVASSVITRSPKLPLICPRLLVLEDNRVVGGGRSRRGADRQTTREQQHERKGRHHSARHSRSSCRCRLGRT